MATLRIMDELSLDYAGLMSSFDPLLDPILLGAALLTALADRYQAEHQDCALHQFEQFGASYLFDLASSADLPQEDRTVAAWALTPLVVTRRDTSYQRGFPMSSGPDVSHWSPTNARLSLPGRSAAACGASSVPSLWRIGLRHC